MSEELEHTWQLHHLDPDSLAAVAYLTYKNVYNKTPVKSGYMRSCTYYDYDTDAMTITVGNLCEYAVYQDTVTAYTGWWEAACHDALEQALTTYGLTKASNLKSPQNQKKYTNMIEKILKRYNL